MSNRIAIQRAFTGAAITMIIVLAVSGSVANSAKIGTHKGMLTLYSGQKFTGDFLEITKDRPSISTDFMIGSVGVFKGEKWELCEGPGFKEPCIVFSANETDMGDVLIRSTRRMVAETADQVWSASSP